MKPVVDTRAPLNAVWESLRLSADASPAATEFAFARTAHKLIDERIPGTLVRALNYNETAREAALELFCSDQRFSDAARLLTRHLSLLYGITVNTTVSCPGKTGSTMITARRSPITVLAPTSIATAIGTGELRSAALARLEASAIAAEALVHLQRSPATAFEPDPALMRIIRSNHQLENPTLTVYPNRASLALDNSLAALGEQWFVPFHTSLEAHCLRLGISEFFLILRSPSPQTLRDRVLQTLPSRYAAEVDPPNANGTLVVRVESETAETRERLEAQLRDIAGYPVEVRAQAIPQVLLRRAEIIPTGLTRPQTELNALAAAIQVHVDCFGGSARVMGNRIVIAASMLEFPEWYRSTLARSLKLPPDIGVWFVSSQFPPNIERGKSLAEHIFALSLEKKAVTVTSAGHELVIHVPFGIDMKSAAFEQAQETVASALPFVSIRTERHLNKPFLYRTITEICPELARRPLELTVYGDPPNAARLEIQRGEISEVTLHKLRATIGLPMEVAALDFSAEQFIELSTPRRDRGANGFLESSEDVAALLPPELGQCAITLRGNYITIVPGIPFVPAQYGAWLRHRFLGTSQLVFLRSRGEGSAPHGPLDPRLVGHSLPEGMLMSQITSDRRRHLVALVGEGRPSQAVELHHALQLTTSEALRVVLLPKLAPAVAQQYQTLEQLQTTARACFPEPVRAGISAEKRQELLRDRRTIRSGDVIAIDDVGTRFKESAISVQENDDRFIVGIHVVDPAWLVERGSAAERAFFAFPQQVSAPSGHYSPLDFGDTSRAALNTDGETATITVTLQISKREAKFLGYQVDLTRTRLTMTLDRKMPSDELAQRSDLPAELRSLLALKETMVQARLSEGRLHSHIGDHPLEQLDIELSSIASNVLTKFLLRAEVPFIRRSVAGLRGTENAAIRSEVAALSSLRSHTPSSQEIRNLLISLARQGSTSAMRRLLRFQEYPRFTTEPVKDWLHGDQGGLFAAPGRRAVSFLNLWQVAETLRANASQEPNYRSLNELRAVAETATALQPRIESLRAQREVFNRLHVPLSCIGHEYRAEIVRVTADFSELLLPDLKRTALMTAGRRAPQTQALTLEQSNGSPSATKELQAGSSLPVRVCGVVAEYGVMLVEPITEAELQA